MSDPYPIVPRDGPIPVQARRPIPPVVIDLTPPPPNTPAAAVPHIIYINNAAPPAVQPPAGPPNAPVEQHYTTHHHTYRTTRAPGNSSLGMASLALGIIACVICWVPIAGLAAVPIGAIGAVIGVLGVLVSIVFRRSSPGLPFAGVFVCCLAGGISIASTKSLPYWEQQLQRAFPALATHSTHPIHGSVQLTPLPAPSPSVPNIFDTPPTPGQSAGSVSDHSAAPDRPLSPVRPHAPVQPTSPVPPKLDPTLTALMDRLTAAERASDERVIQTTEYQDAAALAADAEATVRTLRQTLPAGSPDLIQADQTAMKTRNTLTAIRKHAQDADPDVIQARKNLAAARSKSSGN